VLIVNGKLVLFIRNLGDWGRVVGEEFIKNYEYPNFGKGFILCFVVGGGWRIVASRLDLWVLV
jgi:hypothetical protein